MPSHSFGVICQSTVYAHSHADFTFNFENGWKLTQISDQADNSTVANTLAGSFADHLMEGGLCRRVPTGMRKLVYFATR